ncbi:PREDICTED: UDP-glycosyltransferase 73C3-like isoform X3 [Lupinus angustifolius]|nr:PREDICTED: UDP-glycosyltransferase 73C3-like isoform X2 [Lupinus angustifolius]XP_019456383.1 PREDICTED: UDP-glycosyltransferase 73C3-like isoform X3 [Lupinus angustifolius]
MASSKTMQLHFLLVPLMSQSHLIPFTHMAKLLASQGTSITIVLTPLNASRFNNFIDEAKASNLKIKFHLIPFPCFQAGLPEGCENIDTLPSFEYQPRFFHASNMLQDPLEKWLSQIETLPSCIISDICLPWTASIASKFNIPRVIFHIISCFTLLCSHNIAISKVHESVTSMTKTFVVPDLPHRIEFTKSQLPEAMRSQDSKGWEDTIDQFKASEILAQGILINSFEELEMLYVKGYEKVVKKVWCIGPLSLHDNKASIYDDESECFNFLATKKPCSVIYACFGSLSRLSVSQSKELALGLEASNHAFIWVIGKKDFSEELEKWLVDEKYEDRNKEKGIIIRGWAPQVKILSHPNIGAFLTHCGWNSTLEAVAAGVPMITWPMFAEQFYNEKFIVHVLNIGVRVGVEVVVDNMEGEKVLVKKEDVKNSIENVMEQGGEGEHRRKRAKELKEMAHKAVQEGGSSNTNCKLFIHQIMGQIHN